MTSFWTSPYSETEISLALVVLANVDERVLLGELVERRAQPPAVGGPPGADDRLERGGANWRGAPGASPSPRASPTRMSARPETFAISPARTAGRWTRTAGSHDPEGRHAPLAAVAIRGRGRAPGALPRRRARRRPARPTGGRSTLKARAASGASGLGGARPPVRAAPAARRGPPRRRRRSIAEPAKTGWIVPARVCWARASRTRSGCSAGAFT